MKVNTTTEAQVSNTALVPKNEQVSKKAVPENETKKISETDLKALVEKGNAALKMTGRELSIQMDPDLKQPVVQVIDQETKEIVRQFPSEEMLEFAKALDKSQGLLLNKFV